MAYGYVYKVTNKVNGKVYIGQAKSVSQRWYQHKWEAQNHSYHSIFHKALLKYGLESFEIETIDTASSRKELNTKEKEWISKLHSTDSSLGYNICKGGEGASLYGSANGKSKAIICIENSKIFPCVKYANRWLQQTLGEKGAFISACLKKRQKTCGGYHWAYLDDVKEQERLKGFKGKARGPIRPYIPLSEQTKAKIREASKKRRGVPGKGQEVVCLENSLVFKSVKQASRWCKGAVMDYLQGRATHAGGYHWVFLKDLELGKDYTVEKTIIKCVELNRSSATQKELCLELGIRSGDLCSVLSGRQKSVKGLHFQKINQVQHFKISTLDYKMYNS